MKYNVNKSCIIFHQCADKDLAQRLSRLKQDPKTGQLYNWDKCQSEDGYDKSKEIIDKEVEDEEEEEQVWFKGKSLHRV